MPLHSLVDFGFSNQLSTGSDLRARARARARLLNTGHAHGLGHVIRKCHILVFSFLLTIASVNADELLLTGEIELLDSQEFITPWTRRFQIPIQWMAPEGSVVKKDELVVVFDPGDLITEIEQNETTLEDNAQGEQETILRLRQEFIDAQYGLTTAELRLQIAANKAKVPASYQSQLEHETAQFELEKAKNDLDKAQTKLDSKRQELAAEEKSIALEVERIQARLANDRATLEEMFLYAEREGPVLYSNHPWRGIKFEEGQNVQAGMRVATIPGEGNMIVRSWVSEVDWPKLSEGMTVTLATDAYLDQTFSGQISKIGYQSEKKQDWSKSSYYPVSVTFKTPTTPALIPGMSVLIRVPVSPSPSPSPPPSPKDHPNS